MTRIHPLLASLAILALLGGILATPGAVRAEVSSCLPAGNFWVSGDREYATLWWDCSGYGTRTVSFKVCDDLANQGDKCGPSYGYTSYAKHYEGTVSVYRDCGNPLGDSRGFYGVQTIKDSGGSSKSYRSPNFHDC